MRQTADCKHTWWTQLTCGKASNGCPGPCANGIGAGATGEKPTAEQDHRRSRSASQRPFGRVKQQDRHGIPGVPGSGLLPVSVCSSAGLRVQEGGRQCSCSKGLTPPNENRLLSSSFAPWPFGERRCSPHCSTR